MSKRYFYRDPIAAAFMATHHGLKLNYTVKNILAYAIGDTEHFAPPYFISTESQHLLAPRDGDYVHYKAPVSLNIGIEGIGPYAYLKHEPDFFKMDCWAVRRNDVAFIWPEYDQ